jgi:hypothetical protein
MSQNETYTLNDETYRRGRNAIALVAVVGWAASAAGYAADPKRFFAAYLTAFLFALTLTLGAMFFVMMQHLTGAVWSVTMRRLAENVMASMPVVALLFIPVALGMRSLYEWTHAEVVASNEILRGKAAYLNEPFFLLRAAMYLGVWTLLALRLHRISLAQDDTSGTASIYAARRWSAPGLVLWMVVGTLMSFDWIMSLDPHWYSTMFGVYVLSGGTLAFFALLTAVALWLRRAHALREAIHEEHYHDLGKWLFALTVFWGYIAFSQYMLIWYANLPEETIWYKHRFAGTWLWVSAALLAGRFLIPFNALLPRAAKRNLTWLGSMAVWIVAMHYLDLYWLIMPVFQPRGAEPHWMDAATLAGVCGTAAWAFWSKLKRHALVPVGDVRLKRALQFENS